MTREGARPETGCVEQERADVPERRDASIRDHRALAAAPRPAQVFGKPGGAGAVDVGGDDAANASPDRDRLSSGGRAEVHEDLAVWNVGVPGHERLGGILNQEVAFDESRQLIRPGSIGDETGAEWRAMHRDTGL